MDHFFEKLPSGSNWEHVPLYPGIDLLYLDVLSDSFPMPCEPSSHLLQINYCRAGQVAWEMEHGGSIFLNPGDFSLYTLDVCAGSIFYFPTGQYQGLTIFVDLQKAAAHPPELIAEAGIFDGLLWERFCRGSAVAFLSGTEQTERIFGAFYDQPEHLRLPYQRIKVLELLLYLARLEVAPSNCLVEYPSGQIQIVREIHDQLLQHMEQRITIEELSKQYLINPTTLKAAFKAAYGTSLAAHIKGHRMEQAAKMLRETNQSIASIAQAVGYDSQSKFTAAFKDTFQVLPREYRKRFSAAGG